MVPRSTHLLIAMKEMISVLNNGTMHIQKVMSVVDYGLTEGCTGDVVLVEAETVAHAVVDRPRRRLVVKGGSIVVRDGEPLLTAP